MDSLTLHQSTRRRKPLTRELEIRACESALWIALFSAQQAGGLEDLVEQITRLHADAGRRRRVLEAA